jgi:hypothetical protein
MVLIRNRLMSQSNNDPLIGSTFDASLFTKVVSFAEDSLGSCEDDFELLIYLKMGKN